MEKYTLYVIKNILQIRKSQQDIKVDRNLRNTTKNHLIKMKIFDNNKSQASDISKNDEKKEEQNIDIFNIDFYSHVVAIMYIQ